MTTNLPTTHVAENLKINNQAFIDLFEFILTDGSILRLHKDYDVTWQTKLYEGVPIQITGISQTADTEANRPTIALYQKAGIFSGFVSQGFLEGAEVIRYRVMKQHVDTNQNIAQKQSWIVSRVTGLNDNIITMEVRSKSDGQSFFLPVRMFIPPDFPMVSL